MGALKAHEHIYALVILQGIMQKKCHKALYSIQAIFDQLEIFLSHPAPCVTSVPLPGLSCHFLQ